jgi:hypothetical protein
MIGLRDKHNANGKFRAKNKYSASVEAERDA